MVSSMGSGASDGSAQGGQIRRNRSARSSDQGQGREQSAPARDERASRQADALDSVLDDIETSLENNAEEYVNSFVQKGGQ